MPTANELLSTEACDDILVVDLESRKIIIPKNVTVLGVEADDETRILHFHIPRHYCDVDLSEFSIQVHYRNANGKPDMYIVTKPTVEDELIKFDWIVGRHAFVKKGNVTFSVCLKDLFEGIVRREFNTTIATLPVLEGLETGPELVGEHTDIFEQLRNEFLENPDLLPAAISIEEVGYTMPTYGNWTRVCYGDGKYVAVGLSTNYFAYSDDGKHWEEIDVGVSAPWRGVAYGNGVFVAIAYNQKKIVYSYDGKIWNSGNITVSDAWRDITFGNGMFVAIAYNSSKAAYSTDGKTWSSANVPSQSGWWSVEYGNGVFVAITSGNNVAAYSTDGKTWNATTLPEARSWYGLAYGNGKFVAVAGYSNNEAAYSTDGSTWTACTLPASVNWYDVIYGNGKFVAVANGSDVAAYSINGVVWTEIAMPVSDNWAIGTYGNRFIAIATESNGLAFSDDGIHWSNKSEALMLNGADVTMTIRKILR